MGQMKKVESGKSTENSSHSCTDVSRGLKGKKTCSGRGEKAKMGKNVKSSKKKFTCKSIHETSDPSPDDVEKLEHEEKKEIQFCLCFFGSTKLNYGSTRIN
uniref:Uncharacterized protein n=1 Tax=Solanum lycopersicum TaxID=4081 RepID=A0A3Q7GEJ3_SOLLC